MKLLNLGYFCQHHTLLNLKGEKANQLLQNILTSDLSILKPGFWQFSALCSHQGRVLSLFKLIKLSDGEFIIQLTDSLKNPITKELQKYAQFSQVEIEDISEKYNQFLLFNWDEKQKNTDLQCFNNTVQSIDFSIVLSQKNEIYGIELIDEDRYRSILIENKIVEIEAAVSGKFIAQMIELESIGALSYTKGCYIGQEVIARLHYKGRLTQKLKAIAINENDQNNQLNPSDGNKVSKISKITNLDQLAPGSTVLDQNGNKIGMLLQKSSKLIQVVAKL